MTYYNGTLEVARKALKYLAENPRPNGGQQAFNSEHLHQLANELSEINDRLKQLSK